MPFYNLDLNTWINERNGGQLQHKSSKLIISIHFCFYRYLCVYVFICFSTEQLWNECTQKVHSTFGIYRCRNFCILQGTEFCPSACWGLWHFVCMQNFRWHGTEFNAPLKPSEYGSQKPWGGVLCILRWNMGTVP